MENKLISSMRGIAIDSINKAGGGHMGMAIGAAPITYSIIGKKLNITKEDAKWINRDRFVLSAGHGSMSIYSIMHFMGLLNIDDMKNHKVFGSKTPSHPEIDMFDRMDASTGPLGQGVGMAVGMAISQKYLADKFNKDGFDIFDHDVFALHGDGCLQEGIFLESVQLAGTLKLDKLIMIQDFNEVQIDSRSNEVNNIDIISFFKSNKFDTFVVKEPSPENISKAIDQAKKSDKPSFIQVHTLIAKDTPNENKPAGHNGTLDEQQTVEFKTKLGLNNTKPFEYDQDAYEFGQKLWEPKEQQYKEWKDMFSKYSKEYPELAKQIDQLFNGKIEVDFSNVKFKETNVATRNYFVPLMKHLEEQTFHVIGGSADLKSATKIGFDKDLVHDGKNIKYGIREHAMGTINNGIYLDSKLRTIDSTFLAFADYMKPSLRLGALQEIPSVHIFTHDSYQVGGDGPTHQPFDQLPMLRAMSRLKVVRPCDESEMKAAFQYAFDSKDEQVAIIACRQPIKSFNKIGAKLKPAYFIHSEEKFDATILATGSEVELAHKIMSKLKEENIHVNVVSVPVLQELIHDVNLVKELKLDQKPMFAIEASSESMWFQLSKFNKIDAHLSNGYGNSAPGDVIYDKKGFSVENIIPKIKQLIK